MAQLLPDVVFRLLDSSANPISGGTATFYLSGTSTLTPIYSDSGLTTALPNPLSTNSGGLFINGSNAVTAIYIDPAISYRAVFKDASGTTIRDIDPVFSGLTSPIAPYGTRTEMTALSVAATQLTVNTNGFAVVGVGGAEYVRTSYATITAAAYPPASYFRSLDRYMPDGSTDATNGGYWLLVSNTVTPCQFGAVGTGAATLLSARFASLAAAQVVYPTATALTQSIDYAAIKAALTFLVAGGTLDMEGKTYYVNDQVAQVFNDGVTVRIKGYGAKIDGTAITGGTAGDKYLLTLGGQLLTSSLLSASPAKGDLAITTLSAVGAVAGEVVLITSTDLFNPTRPYYYKGELAQVRSVSGATLNLSSPLFSAYTNTTTTVHRLALPTVVVEGLEVEMNSEHLGITLNYVRNPVVRDCKVYGARYAGIYVNYFYGGSVFNNAVWDAWYTGTGTSYGISLGTGQYIDVFGNDLSQARHAIAQGGTEPARWNTVRDNKCRMHPSQASLISIDAHGNVEFCTISGNDAEGINCAGSNMFIFGNRLSGNQSYSLINIYAEISCDFYIIKDNNIETTNTGGQAVYITPVTAGITIGKVVVEGTTGSAGGSAIYFHPRSSSITGCTITSVELRRNTLKGGAAQALLVNSNGAATLAIPNILSEGNVWDSVSYDAFTLVSTNVIGTVRSIGDTFRGNRSGGYLATFAGVDVDLIAPSFVGNTGGAGNARSVYYSNTGKVRVSDPRFSNITYKAEIDTATEYFESGFAATTPTILNTGAARLVSAYGSTGLSTSYGTAAPVANAYLVGERVLNSAPSVGQPKSWVCTVAGTPGTWVSEGTL